MKRLLPILFIAGLFAGLFASDDSSDRRPAWDALKLVSFNRGDASDVSWQLQAPTVSSGVTFVTRAADFDGTSSAEITYPDLSTFESAPFTVCLWARVDPIASRVNIIGKSDNSVPYPGWFLHWIPVSGWGFATVENSASAYRFASYSAGSTHNDGVWRHLALVCSAINSNMDFYINGAVVTTAASNVGTVTGIAAARGLTLGGLNFSVGHSVRLNGALDDVRIFSTAKTATEIASIYSEGLGVTRP